MQPHLYTIVSSDQICTVIVKNASSNERHNLLVDSTQPQQLSSSRSIVDKQPEEATETTTTTSLIASNNHRGSNKYEQQGSRRTLKKGAHKLRRHRWPGTTTLFYNNCRTKRGQKSTAALLLEAVSGRHNNNNGTFLFGCPACKNILDRPVTFECGHSFCGSCLDCKNNISNNNRRGGDLNRGGCDCGNSSSNTNPDSEVQQGVNSSRSVNVLVQELADKWRGWRSDVAASVELTPKTMSIMGVQPRYHLRSGLAGLQQSNENDQSAVESATLRKTLYEMVKTLETNRLSKSSTASPISSTSDLTLPDHPVWGKTSTITLNDLDCILCSRCFLDPVTTSCGHTFCRDCLLRVLDHGLPCPLCMGQLSAKDYSRGTTAVLDQAIRVLFPSKHKERLFMNWMDIYTTTNGSTLPVFICTNAFPGVACPLYVSEPRYRLLVRRCLMSPIPRFAMVAKDDSEQKFVRYGTVLEVKDAVHLEDGSFILTTVGIRRFKVYSHIEHDGYDVAKVQLIRDATVNADRIPELIALHEKVYNKTSQWIMSLSPKALEEVERIMGRMPMVEKNWLTLPDGPLWTWWLMPILPLISRLQVCFLSTTSLEKRLRAIDKLLERVDVKMMALERNMNCSCSGMPYRN